MPVKNATTARTKSSTGSPVEGFIRTVDTILETEDLSKRIDAGFGDPAVEVLGGRLNKLLAFLEERSEDYHSSTMELALGLAECFEVLSEARRGNLQARVSREALDSSNEVVSGMGKAINDTVADLQEQMDTIHHQQMAILQLSTPVLQIWDKVIALPIIGIVDTRRSADIMERLLESIIASKCKYVILDITGVDVVDTRTADHFIKVVKAAQMLGTTCMITGIRPAVAQTLVGIGVELTDVLTLGNMQEGLEECMRRMAKTSKVAPA